MGSELLRDNRVAIDLRSLRIGVSYMRYYYRKKLNLNIAPASTMLMFLNEAFVRVNINLR